MTTTITTTWKCKPLSTNTHITYGHWAPIPKQTVYVACSCIHTIYLIKVFSRLFWLTRPFKACRNANSNLCMRSWALRGRIKKKKLVRKRRKEHKENGFGTVFYRCLFICFRIPKKSIYTKKAATIFQSEKKKSGKKIRLLNPNDNMTTLIFLYVLNGMVWYSWLSGYLPQIIHKHLRLPIEQQH